MINKLIFFCFFVLFAAIDSSEALPVQIALATTDDIVPLLELDREVSLTYFKKLYQTHYTNWDFGQQPDYYLNLDLAFDALEFKAIVREQEASDSVRHLLLMAKQGNEYLGLLVGHVLSSGYIEIRLLLVADDARGKGVGSALVQKFFDVFKQYKKFVVYPFAFGNERVLHFYESVGFKNNGFGPADKFIYGVSCSEIVYEYIIEKI